MSVPTIGSKRDLINHLEEMEKKVNELYQMSMIDSYLIDQYTADHNSLHAHSEQQFMKNNLSIVSRNIRDLKKLVEGKR